MIPYFRYTSNDNSFVDGLNFTRYIPFQDYD